MKHVTTFEKWTSTTTDDVEVNYGDKKPEFSEIVQYTEEYIKENFDKIRQVELTKKYITFRDTEEGIQYIMLKDEPFTSHTIYSLLFQYLSPKKTHEIDITKAEYDHILDVMIDTEFKLRRNSQKAKYDDVISDLDPLRRTAKKYNL